MIFSRSNLLSYVVVALAPLALARAADPLVFDTFDRDQARSRLLEIKSDSSLTQIEITPAATAGSAQEAFISYYLNKILPRTNEINLLGRQLSATKQLLDSGLYKDAGEKADWEKQNQEIFKRFSEIQADPAWEQTQIEWGRLAEGLSGELARSARENAQQLKFNQFPPEAQPLLEEGMRLNQEVDSIADTSPLKDVAQKLAPESTRVLMDFFADRLTFDQAWPELERLDQMGSLAYGHDVATRAQTQLNRIAVIRSQLAKLKGFTTWSDFQIAEQSIAHRADFQSKEKLLSFLKNILTATDKVSRSYNELTAKMVAKRPFSQLRPSQASLLGKPTNLLVREYFPKERFVEIWRRTMLESGFNRRIVDDIMVDAFPRPNKNGHAYMRPVEGRHVSLNRINGLTLDPDVPVFESPLWKPATIYILQNFTDDGLPNLRTGFHEGGHALDYSYQMDTVGYNSAYGYAETHSMTMEHFLIDRDFLMANGQAADGRRLTEDLVKTFLLRRTIQDLEGFRGNVATAIFDIELWNYDFSQPNAETYVERALRLSREINEAESFIAEPKDLQLTNGYSRFTTSHFRSGSVRYFGYVLADVSSSMVADALLDKLEQLSGKRSLYQQPKLAETLVEGLYKRGFVDPFPASIEHFTGKPFSPDLFSQSLIAGVERYIAELKKEAGCDPLLE